MCGLEFGSASVSKCHCGFRRDAEGSPWSSVEPWLVPGGLLPHKHPQTQIAACPSVFFQVMDIEILEFQVPTENNKMLLVWDIEPSHTKAQVHVSPPGSGLGEPLRSRSHVDTCVLSFRRSCTASSPALVPSTS